MAPRSSPCRRRGSTSRPTGCEARQPICKNPQSRHADAGDRARSPSMRGKSDLQESVAVSAIAEAPPHYHGHRKRLRARFRQAGAQGLAEYELLELVLVRALPPRDVKPIAKELLKTVGSFAEVISAPPARLADDPGPGERAVPDLKMAEAAPNRSLPWGPSA